MNVQQTLVIVKPDGIEKGLIGQILREIEANALVIVESVRLHLDRTWVEELYGSERDQVYFEEVVQWVSSSRVLLLRVQGQMAVEKIKWEIIGRYPNGIRGLYSENWIKNVAHAPDSIQSAQNELQHASQLFESETLMTQTNMHGKMIFALTGMSECGKSTVGLYLDSKGVRRLKIVRLFEKVRNKWSPQEDLNEFLKRQEERDPYALWDAFIEELLLEMGRIGTSMASIESLYGGGLGPYLKRKLGDHFSILFIDMSADIRLRRQMQREKLGSIKEAKNLLLPRDEIKTKSGIPALKEIAGDIIDNSGTLTELYLAIDAVVKKHSK